MKPNSTFKKLSIAALLLSMTALGAHAVTIVDYSGYDYKSGVDLLGSPPQDLDLNNAVVTSTDYDTLPTGNESATVYVGGSTNAKMFGDTVNNIGGSGGNSEVRNAVLWQKADFMNDGDSLEVNLDGSSSFELTWGGRDNEPLVAARWLILQDNTLYVSNETKILEDTGQNEDNTAHTVSSGDFTSMQWAAVDLTNDITADPGSFSSLNLNDIEGVGFYFTSDDGVTGNAAGDTTNGFRWSEFSATATVIPEPSAGALMLFAAGGLLFLLRPRRK